MPLEDHTTAFIADDKSTSVHRPQSASTQRRSMETQSIVKSIGTDHLGSDDFKIGSDEESNEKRSEVQPTSETITQLDDFPDGGFRAWLVVFGCMCITFTTFGYVNSWGIFQAYYQDTLLKNQSPSSIAWIGSIQYSLTFLPALIVGRLFDVGYFRSVMLTSTIVLVVATFLTAECKEYWQFVLCQGIAVGIACGCLFGPSTAIIAHWFKKNRGKSLGYMAVGSSIGGTTLPIAAKNLISRVGFPWTMRIIGFILLLFLGIANMTTKRRLPPVSIKGGLFSPSAFKSVAYTTYCISAFVIFLGLYTVLTYVNVSAAQLGSSPELAPYFVSFANASSLFGRWFAGVLADRIGPMNVMIPFTIISGVLTYAWPFARSTPSLIVVTVMYGFCSGTYVALMGNPIMNLGGEGDVGRRVGMLLSITAIGALVGPPISGAIEKSTGGFEAVGIYAGTCVVVGVFLLLVVKYSVLKSFRGRL